MNWELIYSYFWTIGVPVLLLVGVTLWVFRPGSRKRYQRDAQIPFEDEDKARASRKAAARARQGDDKPPS